MDTKKKRLLIAGTLLLLVFLLIFFWPKKTTTEPVLEERPASAPAPTPEPSLVAPLLIREEPTPTQASAEAVARTFAERFSSFSAESRFANIRDLYPLMTSSFRAQQEAVIASSTLSETYYGVTSKLVSLTSFSFSESATTMEAVLQRTESRESAINTATKYETLRMDLVFQNGTWLVRGAEWAK
ncbi:MAG: hypothetical protein UY81_C0011G0017 [Candidatus Giovannonibacteria bacterium GW2011_GWA2_53_7]|uniref:Uncharacterized protein n=1 Tax=Candidatus Giovannonibacteria bacterium GW2011_GWA2_53_7 TaxID=1618650 RepID=A0A0G2A7H0_9BACT|nr:MAG: hypothetical protein UY81_C0011G0017 [Candidatus Giovannonibacteria bacterium GW2011_GWA2_53_7]